jgi:hypothetical protein
MPGHLAAGERRPWGHISDYVRGAVVAQRVQIPARWEPLVPGSAMESTSSVCIRFEQLREPRPTAGATQTRQQIRTHDRPRTRQQHALLTRALAVAEHALVVCFRVYGVTSPSRAFYGRSMPCYVRWTDNNAARGGTSADDPRQRQPAGYVYIGTNQGQAIWGHADIVQASIWTPPGNFGLWRCTLSSCLFL